MSEFSGKYIIGLTGNIATGKSVVRKMLEHVGAYGIDADALSHRAIQRGAPGYQSVLDAFGRYILDNKGEIDRQKLGKIVFSDPEALAILESIVHPLVRQGVHLLIRKSPSTVFVIEAIKLLESPLAEICDSIWVTTADAKTQLSRLQKFRGFSEEEAIMRMAAQAPQDEKVARADTVIHNNASIQSAWEQVKAAWKLQFPQTEGDTVPTHLPTATGLEYPKGMEVSRARPRQAQMIADFISKNGKNGNQQVEDVLLAFGEKAFLMLQSEDGVQALIGWKVENLVTRVDEIVWAADISLDEILPMITREVEEASRELQCEIVLFFLNRDYVDEGSWQTLGYEKRMPNSLNVSAWEEAAFDSFEDNNVMFFKALRADRILRPI